MIGITTGFRWRWDKDACEVTAPCSWKSGKQGRSVASARFNHRKPSGNKLKVRVCAGSTGQRRSSPGFRTNSPSAWHPSVAIAIAHNQWSIRSACCKRVCARSKPPDLSSRKLCSMLRRQPYSRRRARPAIGSVTRATILGSPFWSVVPVTDTWVCNWASRVSPPF